MRWPDRTIRLVVKTSSMSVEQSVIRPWYDKENLCVKLCVAFRYYTIDQRANKSAIFYEFDNIVSAGMCCLIEIRIMYRGTSRNLTEMFR